MSEAIAAEKGRIFQEVRALALGLAVPMPMPVVQPMPAIVPVAQMPAMVQQPVLVQQPVMVQPGMMPVSPGMPVSSGRNGAANDATAHATAGHAARRRLRAAAAAARHVSGNAAAQRRLPAAAGGCSDGHAHLVSAKAQRAMKEAISCVRSLLPPASNSRRGRKNGERRC